MNIIKLVLLIILLALVGCGPTVITQPEVTSVATAISPNPTVIPLPTKTSTPIEIIESSQNLPLDTPTPVVMDTPSAPLPTPTPALTPTPTAAQILGETRKGDEERYPLTPDMALVFHRSGGFAGLDQRWIIFNDGRIEGPDGQQQIEPDEVQTLLQSIADHGFFDLNDVYMPEITCCDFFTYNLTVQYNGQRKSITTMDSAESPQALQDVLSEINRLINSL